MSVKLQPVQRNYRLRNHFGMPVTSLTPVVNCWNRANKSKVWINHRFIVFKKSWHRLRIKEMIKWWRFCRILKRLNVNSEYCVKRVNFLFCLRFIHYRDVLFKNYDFRSSYVKKPQFWRQNSISYLKWFPWCFGVFLMIKWSSDKVKVTVNKSGVTLGM